jgi:hypothetical protein
MNAYAFEITHGEYRRVRITVTTNGQLEDLTGATYTFLLATFKGADARLVKTGTVQGTLIDFELTPEDWEQLNRAGRWFCECWVVDTTGRPSPIIAEDVMIDATSF